MANEVFEPTEIALVQNEADWLLVARDGSGAYVGVVCPPDLPPILSTFISSSNPSLIRCWRTYRDSKGAGAFFWDIIGIAEGIRDLVGVPRVRRLLHFASATDLFHNSWQARLMRIAAFRGRRPEILRPSSRHRQADFRIQPSIDVEIKTSFTDSAIELDAEGMRLSPPDSEKLGRAIREKAQDALEQVGTNGVIVVALWCDLAANAVCRLENTRPIDTIDLLPGSFVLALGPSEGTDPYTAISLPIAQVDEFARSVSSRLREYTKPVLIPFTGRHVCVVNRCDWTSVGRHVRISNWQIAYAPYEVSPSKHQWTPITADARSRLAAGIRAANQAMTDWKQLIATRPLESCNYSSRELNNDPRFAALFTWGKRLCDVLIFIGQQGAAFFSDLLPVGRPRSDALRFLEAVFRPEGPIDAEGLLRLDQGAGVLRMERLTRHLAASCHGGR